MAELTDEQRRALLLLARRPDDRNHGQQFSHVPFAALL
jgi:hypothetical protein